MFEFKERVYLGGSAGGTGGGVGMYLMRNETFSLSTEITGARERKESYGDGLAGMGKRGGATFGGSNVSYKLGSVTAGAGVAIGLGSDEGSMASFNLATQKVYGRRWIAGVSTTQAARRQALIDAGDSRLYASEGSSYAPKGGPKHANVSTSLGYLLRRARRRCCSRAAVVSVGTRPTAR